jgi:glycerate kinase
VYEKHRPFAGRKLYDRFILAPDSFKGTMSADEVCDIWNPSYCIISQRLSYAPPHGGRRREGMVNAYLRVLGGERFTLRVSGPLGETG